jgi:hypothetical protein
LKTESQNWQLTMCKIKWQEKIKWETEKQNLNLKWIIKYETWFLWFPPSSLYTCIDIGFFRIEKNHPEIVCFVRDYASRGQIYHFIHLTLRLLLHPREPRRGQMTFGHIR